MKILKWAAIIAIAAMVVVLAADGIVRWTHPRHTQSAKSVPSSTSTANPQATTNKPATPPAPTVDSAEPSDAQMLLAIVHKGESEEKAFMRQFAANPTAYGFTGKQDDAKAIHRWAGRQAHLLAIKAGYYDWKFGAEIRVSAPDKMAFVIQKNAAGNLTVIEYAVTGSTAMPIFSRGATHVSSETVGTSTFFGASPTTGNKLPVPHGEYVYFPG